LIDRISMGKSAGYKVKLIQPLPIRPVIAICLPGDGYVGKFCGESLIASTLAGLAVTFNPYNFPPRVAIEKGKLVLYSYQFYVGGAQSPNLVILTTDLKITDSDLAVKACGQLAKYIKELAPREVLIFDACVPTKKYRGNNITQMLVATPPSEFWESKALPTFNFKNDTDKFFLSLAVALAREGVPARAIICDTSGRDIDPDGAKKLLDAVKGHPAFPAQFDHQKIDSIAKEIHEELAKLIEKDREKVSKETKRQKQEDQDIHYIQ
jgi:proteasome assembly chaperone (PAC2) family protein